MGPMTTVTAGWLAQRAAADDAARSEQLAAELRGKIRAGAATGRPAASTTPSSSACDRMPASASCSTHRWGPGSRGASHRTIAPVPEPRS